MLYRIDGEDYALNGDDEADLTATPGTVKAPGSPPRYCVAIRTDAAYESLGERPFSGPSAAYTFRYFAGTSVVHVSAEIRQDYPCPWEYLRFLWLKVFDPDRELFQYGLRSKGSLQDGKGPSTPATRLELSEETAEVPRASWVALCSERPGAPLALGFLGLGWGQLYVAPEDDPEDERRRIRGEYEDYYLSGPQNDWNSTGRRLDGALWLGPIRHGAATLERAALQTRAAMAAYLTNPAIEAALDAARATAHDAMSGARRGRTLWVLHHLERQVHIHGELAQGYDGIVNVADAIAEGEDPETAVDWFGDVAEGTRFVDNGEIGIGLDIHPGEGGGVGLLGLYDLTAERPLVGGDVQSPWTLELLYLGTQPYALLPTWGWDDVTLQIEEDDDSVRLDLTFRESTQPLPSGITVSTSIELVGRETRWQLRVDNDGLTALRHVRFPEVWVEGVGQAPENDTLLIPRGPGAAKAARFVEYTLCPTVAGWQNAFRVEIGERTLDNLDVDGLYLDQAAAEPPVTCFHPEHDHPRGGGHWWTRKGYWPLLDQVRSLGGEPATADFAITTESNAEPYLHKVDGMLVWRWGERPDEVPLFPAIYGGRIILFGRTYHAGVEARGVIAKATQSFVWGEQPGWLKVNGRDEGDHSASVHEDWDSAASQAHIHLSNLDGNESWTAEEKARVWNEEIKPLFKRIVALRHELRRYFDGEMLRPLPLIYTVSPGDPSPPRVTADWGIETVTVEAVQRSVWQALDGDSLALAANVSSEDVSISLTIDADDVGFESYPHAYVTIHTEEGTEPEHVRAFPFTLSMMLESRDVVAVEIRRPHVLVPMRGGPRTGQSRGE